MTSDTSPVCPNRGETLNITCSTEAETLCNWEALPITNRCGRARMLALRQCHCYGLFVRLGWDLCDALAFHWLERIHRAFLVSLFLANLRKTLSMVENKDNQEMAEKKLSVEVFTQGKRARLN